MAITKYDYAVLQQNLIDGLDKFLTPLFDWVKIEKSEDLIYSSTNQPYINFYVYDDTALCFKLATGVSTLYAAPIWQIRTRNQASEDESYFSVRFDDGDQSYYYINKTYKARMRFTKVGTDGFMFGIDCYRDDTRFGDYTIPLIMCCNIGNKKALVSCGVRYNTATTMPTMTTNYIYADGMTSNQSVSLTRRVTDNIEQLVPICTSLGEYSTNGFTPTITYNNTMSPKPFTMNGKTYFGNGLMVLLDDE